MNQFSSIWLHVALQFLAPVGLIIAGIGVFRQWRKNKGVFFSSMGLLVGSISLAIIIYGLRGHGSPIFMYLIGAWALVIGGVFTAATLLLGRLVHNYDERLSEKEKISCKGKVENDLCRKCETT